ncbi:T6SS immunity protein Tdi1 domain-containing protein [Xanthocytophaga flava]|uniref:T6SS immunity protein Tdi1 domain-containing protein n=1 Tax=Xanthocytophaga flava TaxID=3048013 RepID=UPI0028D4459F|nr:T6SS immunity protein Tdi1 domain-containing protein [Xanthocytophaga flavus]MDJ1467024.1 DUF1851 domain-containing protein [Xanthocytophaga flavus]
MLDIFLSKFTKASSFEGSRSNTEKNTGIESLLNYLGGCSFDNGLYRIHTSDSSKHWTKLLSSYFSVNGIKCFAFDWAGKQYATDNKDEQIIVFDPAEMQIYTMKVNWEKFHDYELVDYREEDLDEKLFKEWMTLNDTKKLSIDKCIGYKQYLFLGGEDNFDNMELVDIEIYWELSNQIYRKTKDLPSETNIRGVSLD